MKSHCTLRVFDSYLYISTIIYIQFIIPNIMSPDILCLDFLRMVMIASNSALILKRVTCFLSTLASQMYIHPVASMHTVASSSSAWSPAPIFSLRVSSGVMLGTIFCTYPRRA